MLSSGPSTILTRVSLQKKQNFIIFDLMEKIRVLALQYDTFWEQKEKNHEKVRVMIESAPKADLIVLPEMFNTGFTMAPEKWAEKATGPTLEWVRHLARDRQAAVCASWPVEVNNNYYNRLYFVFPEGGYIEYDKRHLFSYGKEDQHYSPGHEQASVHYRGWNINLYTCYDLRFPVWMRNTQDADLYLIPANWPDTRINQWSCLLRARAIENQVYVVGVNRVGQQAGGLQYNGASAIIDYSGQVVTERFDDEAALYCEIEKEGLNNFRSHFPFLQDRDDFQLRETKKRRTP